MSKEPSKDAKLFSEEDIKNIKERAVRTLKQSRALGKLVTVSCPPTTKNGTQK